MHPTMSAEACYNALRATIAEQTEANPELSMFELIGAVRLIEAELIEAALTEDDEDDDEEAAD